MRNCLAKLLICLLLSASTLMADDSGQAHSPPEPSAEDLKIIAMMEILQMMDLAEEMEMVKEIDYLIEDRHDENN